jgi:aminopeptidase N
MGDDAVAGKGLGQGPDRVAGATKLERADTLEILAFELQVGAGKSIYRSGPQHRRHVRMSGDARRSGFDIGYIHALRCACHVQSLIQCKGGEQYILTGDAGQSFTRRQRHDLMRASRASAVLPMSKPAVRLVEYSPPAWRMDAVDLEFDLDVEATIVLARLQLSQDPAQSEVELSLHGEDIELLDIRVDGRVLGAGEFSIRNHALHVPGLRGKALVETRSRIRPVANTAMQGLYLSGSSEQSFLLSQCEAEGFRHITWSVDRPDVLARYRVTLRANQARFPVLLAGGNADGRGELEHGRHWARFVDPQPRPSYLFAMVAGQLDVIEDEHVTAQGRKVRLLIWAERAVVDRCRYAMQCLKQAMAWDEQCFGRNYQLDVFHIVATDDFTMGAMENTGLNIFNSKYLLADPLHATDDDYRHVLAVVAHEYFHNWTGNRVTCRDWFQLCLKEGLTVYREQEFVSDRTSRALRRIEDVRTLWRTQFVEDSGPLAHPVRPSIYKEINNFYTATVYEKGAEIVRMLATLLGREGFRSGMDLYFERHDGGAVTVEDFLAALGDANGRDLSPWLAWYTRAGTPELACSGSYDPNTKIFELSLSQHVAQPPAESHSSALPIPVGLALFDTAGKRLKIDLEGAKQDLNEAVVLLDQAEACFRFHNLESAPIVSLLRGYSAPVRLRQDGDWRTLALLAGHEDDGFNRWYAADALARQLFLRAMNDDLPSQDAALAAWTQCLLHAFGEQDLDPAMLAEMLTLADLDTLGESLTDIDPPRLHLARKELERSMAKALEPALLDRYRALAAASFGGLEPAMQSGRRLRNRCLNLLCSADSRHHALARHHLRDAVCLSDKLAALTCLVHGGDEDAARALDEFARQYSDSATVMDKWFSVQATVAEPETVVRVEVLTRHPAFRWDNPNKVYALLLGFALRNPVGFHREDGAGYRFIADAVCRVDRLMPQVASRLATAFGSWQRIEPGRSAAMRAEMIRIQASASLSADVSDILARSLAVAAAGEVPDTARP